VEKVVFFKKICSQIDCQMIPHAQTRPLTNVQQEILKLYSTEFTEQELHEFRKELGAYFARKTTEAADRAFEAQGYTADDLERWLHE
jgi:hypothetical protein